MTKLYQKLRYIKMTKDIYEPYWPIKRVGKEFGIELEM